MSVRFLYFELVTVTVMKLTTFRCRKNATFSFCIDKTCICDILSESPLNTDTRIIRTLWHVPVESVLTGFCCALKKIAHNIRNQCISLLFPYNFIVNGST